MKRLAVLLSLLVVTVLCLSGCSIFSTGGQSAYQLAVEHGFEGTEQQWLESLKGDTVYEYNAYDVAVENGYEGTEQQWLASLRGEPGADGTVDVTITDNGTDAVYPVSKALSSSVSVVCKFTDGYSSGSGVVYQMDTDSNISYIVTNYHVVYDGEESTESTAGNWGSSDSDVDYISNEIVIYPYGSITSIEGTFVGGSIDYDVAVIAVSTQSLADAGMRAVNIGGTVTTGQSIYVVGNAEGEGISATSGIVSVYRTNLEIGAVDNKSNLVNMSCIQIDAPVNHGNSGGGLFDSEGKWVGIINAKIVEEDVEGMGYAIPLSIAHPIVDKLIIAYEDSDMTSSVSAQRYLIGISSMVTSSSAVYDDDTGLIDVRCVCQIYGEYDEVRDTYSGGVTAGSLGESAGLQSGDTLLSATIDSSLLDAKVSIDIDKNYALGELMLWATAEDELTLVVSRDGVDMTFTITFAEATATVIR